MREAPFKVGGIVEPPYFIGREEEMAILTQGLLSLSQNYLLLAPRRYGKSSLMYNLRRRLEQEQDILAPYVNCREMASYSDFYRTTVTALLREYELKRRVPGLAARFAEVFKSRILQAARRIEEIGGSVGEIGGVYLRFRDNEIDEKGLISGAFRFFRDFALEKRVGIAFMLDEFQETAEFNGYLFDLFKKELDLPSQVRYLFSGSATSMLSRIFLRDDSPLYLMVSRHRMGPLKPDETARFVRERLKVLEVEISDHAAELFHSLTGGIPFYVQKLGVLVVQDALLRRAAEIKERDVKAAFASMLSELDSEFEVRWLSQFSNLQRRIVRAVAAAGKARLSVIAAGSGSKPSDISSSVRRLVESMALERYDETYSLTDRVFAAWVRNI